MIRQVQKTEVNATTEFPSGMVELMELRIEPAGVADIQEVVAEHTRFWGERDLRSLHLLPFVHEFPNTCLVARFEAGIAGYVLGFVTPTGTGYVHLAATRDDARGLGVGRRLYVAFADAARRQGAQRLKAITSPGNTGSIEFHRSVGFDTAIVEDYNGPDRPMVVFSRSLPCDT